MFNKAMLVHLGEIANPAARGVYDPRATGHAYFAKRDCLFQLFRIG
jgi:hypothetical protein